MTMFTKLICSHILYTINYHKRFGDFIPLYNKIIITVLHSYKPATFNKSEGYSKWFKTVEYHQVLKHLICSIQIQTIVKVFFF